MGTLSAQKCLSILHFICANLALPLKYLIPSQRVELPGMMMTTSAGMKRNNGLMLILMAKSRHQVKTIDEDKGLKAYCAFIPRTPRRFDRTIIEMPF
eukprot:7299730-Ditylum_brightwellii.AAC.1